MINKFNVQKKMQKKILLFLFMFYSFTINAQFTMGNLVVFQSGDGNGTLINTGNPILFREYTPQGVLNYSMAVPSTGTNALINSGSATSEGFLSLSSDKQYLVFCGYTQALPNSNPVASSNGTLINRGIGLVAGIGLASFSVVATSSVFFSANNIRGAAATNSSNLWGSGAIQGVNYFGNSTLPSNVQNTKINLRSIQIFNNQLYASSQVASGTPADIGIFAIGSGTPLTSGQTASTVINTGVGSQPAQFYFDNLGTTCYIADQRNALGGGIQKWVYSSNTWSLSYTLPTGTAAIGATGVVADFSGINPIVYATTNETSTNRLIAINDVGALSTASTIATATMANTVFRGLAFSPCTPLSVNSITSNTNIICSNQSLSLSVSLLGSSPISYSWSGTGAINSNTISNPIISNPATGLYSVSISNGCSSTSTLISISVSPSPTIIISSTSSSICAGQTLALTASGASTYSWSNGGSNGAIFSPTSTNVYTVTGFMPNSCNNSATISILVHPLPSIISNSITICSGQPGTLIASGANSYTWNTGSLLPNLIISPTVSTIYTLSGSSNLGCINSITTQIVVTNAPSISINSSTICSGNTATLIAGGTTTYTWNTGASGYSLAVSPTVNTTYSVSGNLIGCVAIATNTANVVVRPLPTLSITGETVICLGNSISHTITGASSYSWSNGSTSSIVVLSPTVTSTYTVIGLSAFNCSTSAQFTQIVSPCTGINENNQTLEFRLYPNPAQQKTVILFNTPQTKYIQITNTLGQVIFSIITNNTEIHLDLENFEIGMYFVNVISKNTQYFKKLIRE